MHHGKVVGLSFGETPSGQTRLFSLGQDNRIAEYELARSTPATGLVVAYHHDFASTSLPTSLCFAPPLQYFKHHSTRTLLIITGECSRARGRPTATAQHGV